MTTPIPASPAPPKIPTGQELYDALMAHIEPELTTENAKKLGEQYKNETVENHAQRVQRYELAFERCQTAYEEYMATLDAQVNRYKREVFDHAELTDRAHDENVLDAFDPLFRQAA